MNCTGGVLYHDLGLKFLSPTINMMMTANDFIDFCENLGHYLSIDNMIQLREPSIIGSRNYPIACLDNITLHFVHYKSFENASAKWNERRKRVNRDKIVIIACDRDGMDDDLINRFQKLPYKKVMFCNKKHKINKDCVYIKGYEDMPSVGIITDPIGWFGKRAIDQYDWVDFLNKI